MTAKGLNQRSMEIYAAWRAQGAWRTVTADEAYRLSGGLAGRPGDRTTVISLSAAALRTASRQMEDERRGVT